MNIRNLIIGLLLAFTVVGCSNPINNNFYDVDVFKSVSFDNEAYVSASKKIFLEDMLAASRIYAVDSFLIVTLFDREYYFNIYNLNTSEKLGNFCRRGRGPNEILFMDFKGFDRDDDGRYFWNIDINSNIASKFNIDSSVVREETYFSNQFKIPSSVFRGAWIRDGKILVENVDNYNGTVSFAEINQRDSTLSDIIRLNKNLITLSEYYSRVGYTGLYNPLSDKMAMEQSSMDQINIVDLQSKKITAVTTSKRLTNWDDLMVNFVFDHYYYAGLKGNNNYFVSRYINKSRSERYDVDGNRIPSGVILYVYNWDGDPITQLIVAEDIKDFCFNDDMTIMYGIVDDDEQLYIYDISSLGLNQ